MREKINGNYVGLKCSYCQENTSTPVGDHVPEKSLLPLEVISSFGSMKPRVPCCKPCNENMNNSKGNIYLRFILAISYQAAEKIPRYVNKNLFKALKKQDRFILREITAEPKTLRFRSPSGFFVSRPSGKLTLAWEKLKPVFDRYGERLTRMAFWMSRGEYLPIETKFECFTHGIFLNEAENGLANEDTLRSEEFTRLHNGTGIPEVWKDRSSGDSVFGFRLGVVPEKPNTGFASFSFYQSFFIYVIFINPSTGLD